MARKHQLREYERHLGKQYLDRTVYWAARNASRLPILPTGKSSICIVTDAIDHSKFRFPRSRVFASKEFDRFVRPTLDVTACIAHGRFFLLALSEPHVPKNSSWCSELLLHTLHRCGEQCDIRNAEILLQSDNSSRETKNNTLTRVVALLVGLHRVRRVEMRFLLSGHSHEDIDQVFSQISNLLEQHPELHTPAAMVQCLERWLADQSVRPHERYRTVQMVDQFRDWSLAIFLVAIFSGVATALSFVSSSLCPMPGFLCFYCFPLCGQRSLHHL